MVSQSLGGSAKGCLHGMTIGEKQLEDDMSRMQKATVGHLGARKIDQPPLGRSIRQVIKWLQPTNENPNAYLGHCLLAGSQKNGHLFQFQTIHFQNQLLSCRATFLCLLPTEFKTRATVWGCQVGGPLCVLT